MVMVVLPNSKINLKNNDDWENISDLFLEKLKLVILSSRINSDKDYTKKNTDVYYF